MLIPPTLDTLRALGLTGMAQALEEQLQLPDIGALSFEERLGLLVDRELTARDTRRLKTRLRQATLRHSAACIEDIDHRAARGLDRALMVTLATGQWVRDHPNVLIVGPTGIGKSWIACALAHQVCRNGLSARYLRPPKLFSELATAKGDGRYPRLMRDLAKTDLVVLDDLGLAPLEAGERRDLLEILEERYDRHSTLVSSQYPVEHWHDLIGHPTLADALLDRLVHNAYRLHLTGESMRKRPKTLTRPEPSGS
jgi:DNA replication protein DnaC